MNSGSVPSLEPMAVHVATAERARLVRRGIRLEWWTVAYNSLEALSALTAGFWAGSIVLVGFGFDSVIEVTSGVALLWRLHSDARVDVREERERVTLRIVGACLLALAAYISYDAGRSLVWREPPEHSAFGIAVAVASLIVMPLLARAKRRVAASIRSTALTADATQTQLCMYLSIILLGGLLLNSVLGWWWADPVAAFVMVPLIVKEGLDAIRGRTCCASC
jgi:divalent metal cation (Fe/Co/Zn/Cd) transporter